ncbi:MAG: phosphatase PAP2 family protein [Candidatus Methanogranum gryphiswaldense]|nr:MAG: phosphatase PAP2 family protein [Candidatus Methanogranum sp. U3.2.1]
MGVELDVVLWIQDNLRNPTVDAVMPFFTSTMNYGTLMFIIGLLFLFTKKYRWMGVTFLVGGVISEFSGMSLKYVVDSPRPFMDYPMELLISTPSSPSFPSMHVSSSVMMVTVALLFKEKKIALILLIFATAIAFSRLYLFVHYPIDILGGAILGIICGCFAYMLVRWLRERHSAVADNTVEALNEI